MRHIKSLRTENHEGARFRVLLKKSLYRILLTGALALAGLYALAPFIPDLHSPATLKVAWAQAQPTPGSPTPFVSPTSSPTATPSTTPTGTPTVTRSPTPSPTRTATRLPTATPTATRSPTPRASPTPSRAPTGTPTVSASPSPRPTPTPTKEHPAKNPIKDAWPKLTAEDLKPVQKLIDEGKAEFDKKPPQTDAGNAKYKEALDKLVEILKPKCCTFNTMKGGKPVYRTDRPDAEGSTDREKGGEVRIHRAAFENAAWLYSSLKHEMVHSQQWQDPDAAKKQGVKGRDKQAYEEEIENADNTGVNDEHKRELQRRLDALK